MAAVSKLGAIRRRLEAADKDGWRLVPRRDGVHPHMIVAGDYADQGEPDVLIEVVSEHEAETAAFIVHAPQDIADLLAAVDATRDYIKATESVSEDLQKWEDRLSYALARLEKTP